MSDINVKIIKCIHDGCDKKKVVNKFGPKHFTCEDHENKEATSTISNKPVVTGDTKIIKCGLCDNTKEVQKFGPKTYICENHADANVGTVTASGKIIPDKKVVKCVMCEKELTVAFFAANTQVCKECKPNYGNFKKEELSIDIRSNELSYDEQIQERAYITFMLIKDGFRISSGGIPFKLYDNILIQPSFVGDNMVSIKVSQVIQNTWPYSTESVTSAIQATTVSRKFKLDSECQQMIRRMLEYMGTWNEIKQVS